MSQEGGQPRLPSTPGEWVLDFELRRAPCALASINVHIAS